MKRTIVCSLLISLFLNLQAMAQTPLSIQADFNKSTVTINQTTFTKTSTLADYEKVLGKAERIEKVAGKDKTFAYDKLGISLSLKANTDLVQKIYITYIYDGDKKVAKETYQGLLNMNRKEVKTDTNHEQIAKITGLELKPMMKGLYAGKANSLLLMIYYPESTIGQIALSFGS